MTEEERLALWMQSQINAGVENPQAFPQYSGLPDPALENVNPELYLGGAGSLAAKAVKPLWSAGKKALTTISPVTNTRILRPTISKALSKAKTSVVRPGYGGAPKKGAIVRGPQGQILKAKFAGEGAYAPRLGPTGYIAGGLGLGYLANKENEDNIIPNAELDQAIATDNNVPIPIGSGITQARVGSDIVDGVTPIGLQERTSEQAAFQTDESKLYSGMPMDDNPPVPYINATPQETPKNTEQETPKNTPNLWETWGSLADDPKKRREAYLGSIKNIFMKKMLLDSIATLTGGKSQGDQWATMAIAELDAVEKFNSEERLHNQWKALFFNEDGTYNPPANRKEAMERGQQLGYNADQMKDIMSVFPKETDDRPALQKNISFILDMEDSPTKRALMKKHGLIETDDLTAAEKAANRAVKNGIISEEEKDAYIRSIYVPKDTSTETAAMKNFKWYQEAEGEDKRLIGELLSIDTKGGTVDLFSPSNIASLLNNDYIMGAFSEGEQARLIGIVKQMIPGFNPPANTTKTSATTGGGETREEYEQEVRKRHPNASEADIQATVKAKYG
jgi:hypothetical protein